MANLAGRAGRSILEYLRRAVSPFLINLMFGMTMFACVAIEIKELRIILTFALIILTFITSFLLIRSAGEYAYKMKVAGDRKRVGLPAGMTAEGAKTRMPPPRNTAIIRGSLSGHSSA